MKNSVIHASPAPARQFSIAATTALVLAMVVAFSSSQIGIASSPDLRPGQLQLAWVLQQLNHSSESSNLCNGGLENGKRIVTEAYLRNPMQETTRLGCEVDGGNPIQVPDLPAPDDRATRLT